MLLVVFVRNSARCQTRQVALRHRAPILYHRVKPDRIMNALTTTWSVEKPCEESMLWLQQRLTREGLRLLRTFDLRGARLSAVDCPCPRHGTGECDCQMMVLLVFVETCPPVALMIHGSSGHSWISVVDRPDQRADPRTILAIQRALEIDAAPRV